MDSDFLLGDWSHDLARVNRLLGSATSAAIEEIACLFADGIAVQEDPRKGVVLVATSDICTEQLIIVEQPLDVDTPPKFLIPRCPAEMPSFYLGLPIFLAPRSWVHSEAMMSRMRVSMNGFSSGLFGVSSMISHSCCANASRRTCKDGTSVILADRFIPKGAEITISYSDVCKWPPWCGGYWLRRAIMYYRRGFWCQCDRCAGIERQTKKKLIQKNVVNSDMSVVEKKISAVVTSKRVSSASKNGKPKNLDPIYKLASISLLLQVIVISSMIPAPWYTTSACCIAWFLFGDQLLSLALMLDSALLAVMLAFSAPNGIEVLTSTLFGMTTTFPKLYTVLQFVVVLWAWNRFGMTALWDHW